MANLAEIILPSGTHAVAIGDIPILFANAIQPMSSNDARVVSGLKKRMLDQEGVPLPSLHPLTSNPLHDHNTPEQRLLEAIYVSKPGEDAIPMTDWAWLNLAWIELPSIRFPLPEEEWTAYEAALRVSSDMPDDWLLVPEWDSERAYTIVLNLGAQAAYRTKVADAIEAGELVPLSSSTLLPASLVNATQPNDWVVTTDALRDYAARFQVGVRVADLEPDGGDAFTPFLPLLEVYLNLPFHAIPTDLRVRASEKIDFFDYLWDKLGPTRRRRLVGEWDERHDPANAAAFRHGWWDNDMDATLWWERASISPREAAALLCRHNPLIMQPDAPEAVTTDKTDPDDFKRLLRVFEDVERTQSQHRTLQQWLSIALANRLRYHGWIDEWLEGRAPELVGGTQAGKDNAPTATSPIQRLAAQDAAILAEIRSCTYDPLKLPKAPAGKPGVKAEIRKRLKGRVDIFISAKVFDTAWQRLRDQAEIGDA